MLISNVHKSIIVMNSIDTRFSRNVFEAVQKPRSTCFIASKITRLRLVVINAIKHSCWFFKHDVNSTCKLIDMTVPSDRNIALKEIEKKSKYKDLELEIQRMWYMKTIVIPVVVGALGTVKKGMVENIKKVSERATVTEIQKICMLGSARILRKVLSI